MASRNNKSYANTNFGYSGKAMMPPSREKNACVNSLEKTESGNIKPYAITNFKEGGTATIISDEKTNKDQSSSYEEPVTATEKRYATVDDTKRKIQPNRKKSVPKKRETRPNESSKSIYVIYFCLFVIITAFAIYAYITMKGEKNTTGEFDKKLGEAVDDMTEKLDQKSKKLEDAITVEAQEIQRQISQEKEERKNQTLKIKGEIGREAQERKIQIEQEARERKESDSTEERNRKGAIVAEQNARKGAIGNLDTKIYNVQKSANTALKGVNSRLDSHQSDIEEHQSDIEELKRKTSGGFLF